MTPHFLVLRDRNTRTFGVYVQPAPDGTGQALVEGGFFNKAAAQDARDRIETEQERDT